MVVEKKSGDFKAVEIHLPSWMYSKVALAAMVVVLIAGFIWMTPGLNTAVFGTNAKTGPPTEVKTPAENPVVNTATGAIAIPADAWEVLGGTTSYQHIKYTIGQHPQNIFVKNRHTLFKDIKITNTEISGIAINTEPPEMGYCNLFYVYFWKGDNLIRPVGVYSAAGNTKASIYGRQFRTDRPAETLGADKISISDFV